MRKLLTTLLLTVMLFTLAGCGQKSWILTLDGAYDTVSAPDISSGGHFGSQEINGQTLYEFSAKNDGEYPLVVEDGDGNEYTITITQKSGKVEAKCDGLAVDVKQK